MTDPPGREGIPAEPQRPEQPGADALTQPDMDARFAEIIAGWGAEADLSGRSFAVVADAGDADPERSATADQTVADRSAADDDQTGADDAPTGADEPTRTDDPPTEPTAEEPEPAAPAVVPLSEVVIPWRGVAGSPTLEEDEHYVPPPPAPLPAGDLHFWGILVGLAGGPLLLLYLMIFGRDLPVWWLMLAVAMSAGGFALLVSRLPTRRDDEDDDSGARV